MPLRLRFDLRLETRQPDCVVVSVVLEPIRGELHEGEEHYPNLEGVSLQILGPRGGTVSARTVLPIAGELSHAMVSTLQLRPLDDTIPQRSRVVGVAWGPEGQLEATIPTDLYTQLQAHVKALHRVPLGVDDEDDDERALALLEPEERDRVAVHYPWVEEPRVPSSVAQLTVVDHEPSEQEAFDSMLADLGIDDESAEWLKGLMDEDEAS